jgi:diadenosine tetraphosphatase ApaH/serine/threonine PP2A family protein phosphatase
MGNADEALLDGGRAIGRRPWITPEMAPAILRSQAWAVERLGAERVGWLAALPREWRDGDRVAVVHAVPGDLWAVVEPDASGAELRSTFGALGARIAVCAHVHHPYVRELGTLTVANCGSVGAPYDGDPRASYLLVEDGACAIRRVPYDVERAAAEMERSGHPRASILAEAIRTGRVTQ